MYGEIKLAPRTIEQAEQELLDWKGFEATCQEDYDYACLKVRELTAEIKRPAKTRS